LILGASYKLFEEVENEAIVEQHINRRLYQIEAR